MSGWWEGEVEKWLVDELPDLDGDDGIDDDASEDMDWDGDVCVCESSSDLSNVEKVRLVSSVPGKGVRYQLELGR